MVAIDGSEHSLKATGYALDVAKSFNTDYLQLPSLIFQNPIILSKKIY